MCIDVIQQKVKDMNKRSNKLQGAMTAVLLGLCAASTTAEAQIGTIVDSMQPPIVTAHEGFGMRDHREGDLVTFLVIRSQHSIDAPLDVQVNVSQRGNVLLCQRRSGNARRRPE